MTLDQISVKADLLQVSATWQMLPDIKRSCSCSFLVWNLINTASLTHLGTEIDRTSSPVFIVFQLETGWPEVFVDRRLLGFVQLSARSTYRSRSWVGSFSKTLLYFNYLDSKLNVLHLIHRVFPDSGLACVLKIAHMLSCRVISTCPNPNFGLWTWASCDVLIQPNILLPQKSS